MKNPWREKFRIPIRDLLAKADGQPLVRVVAALEKLRKKHVSRDEIEAERLGWKREAVHQLKTWRTGPSRTKPIKLKTVVVDGKKVKIVNDERQGRLF